MNEIYLITFSPDKDSFFITNRLTYYWKHNKNFNSELDAITYFTSHMKEFIDAYKQMTFYVDSDTLTLETSEVTYTFDISEGDDE